METRCKVFSGVTHFWSSRNHHDDGTYQFWNFATYQLLAEIQVVIFVGNSNCWNASIDVCLSYYVQIEAKSQNERMKAMLLDGDRDLLIDFAGFASRCSVVARVPVVGERSQFALGLQRLLLIEMVHSQCSTAKQNKTYNFNTSPQQSPRFYR